MSSLAVVRRAVATEARRELGNPAALAVTAVFYVMVSGVLSALWWAAAAANDGEVAGYTAAALVWYAVTAEAVVVCLPLRLIEEVGDDIASGRVEVELLRPVDVLLVRLAHQTGGMLPRLGVCVGAGAVLALVVAGVPPDGAALALAVPAIVLGALVSLVLQHVFAGAAFWIADAKGAWFLYSKLVFVLGGMLLPLEVLPSALRTVALGLPFVAVAYAPARLASGHLEPWLVGLQVGWLVVLGFVAVRVFSAGERRLVGARS